MTLASVSAPFQLRLHPVKLTVITDVLFFMALQITKTTKKTKLNLLTVLLQSDRV